MAVSPWENFLLWRLDDLEEVFLSCCETNLGVAESTDDFLTLASGFLCAGARGVISSLWVADDLSAILLSMFYYQLRKEGKSRSAALQQAQKQLRNITGEELAQLLRSDLKPYKDYLEQRFKQANTKWKNASQQLKKLEAMDCKGQDYQDWQKEKNRWGNRAKKYLKAVKNLEEVRCKEEFPFANPFYWAVFICSGLA